MEGWTAATLRSRLLEQMINNGAVGNLRREVLAGPPSRAVPSQGQGGRDGRVHTDPIGWTSKSAAAAAPVTVVPVAAADQLADMLVESHLRATGRRCSHEMFLAEAAATGLGTQARDAAIDRWLRASGGVSAANTAASHLDGIVQRLMQRGEQRVGEVGIQCSVGTNDGAESIEAKLRAVDAAFSRPDMTLARTHTAATAAMLEQLRAEARDSAKRTAQADLERWRLQEEAAIRRSERMAVLSELRATHEAAERGQREAAHALELQRLQVEAARRDAQRLALEAQQERADAARAVHLHRALEDTHRQERTHAQQREAAAAAEVAALSQQLAAVQDEAARQRREAERRVREQQAEIATLAAELRACHARFADVRQQTTAIAAECAQRLDEAAWAVQLGEQRRILQRLNSVAVQSAAATAAVDAAHPSTLPAVAAPGFSRHEYRPDDKAELSHLRQSNQQQRGRRGETPREVDTGGTLASRRERPAAHRYGGTRASTTTSGEDEAVEPRHEIAALAVPAEGRAAHLHTRAPEQPPRRKEDESAGLRGTTTLSGTLSSSVSDLPSAVNKQGGSMHPLASSTIAAGGTGAVSSASHPAAAAVEVSHDDDGADAAAAAAAAVAAAAAAAAAAALRQREADDAEAARVAAVAAAEAERKREAEALEEQARLAAAAAAAAAVALERFLTGVAALEADEPPARAIVAEAETEARDFMGRAGEASRLNAAAATTNRLMREITVTVRDSEDAARQALTAEESQGRKQVEWFFNRDLPKGRAGSESSDGEAESAIRLAREIPEFTRSSDDEAIFASSSDSDSDF